MDYNIQQWLPTTKKEVEQRGWKSIDVILFTGDAYVDHPSFGGAVIGRLLESLGLNVAIVPQPNWQDDLRDFKKLGKPNLFFGISPGCMDSMVNHYTAAKRRRSDDAYTPGNRSGARPDMPTIVYSKILKELFPDTPVIIGGIEASLTTITGKIHLNRLFSMKAKRICWYMEWVKNHSRKSAGCCKEVFLFKVLPISRKPL